MQDRWKLHIFKLKNIYIYFLNSQPFFTFCQSRFNELTKQTYNLCHFSAASLVSPSLSHCCIIWVQMQYKSVEREKGSVFALLTYSEHAFLCFWMQAQVSVQTVLSLKLAKWKSWQGSVIILDFEDCTINKRFLSYFSQNLGHLHIKHSHRLLHVQRFKPGNKHWKDEKHAH